MLFHRKNRADNERPLEDFSDEKIMQEIQAGNGDAFAVMFHRYHRLILVTALKIVRDVAEAEQVTQSVFSGNLSNSETI